MVDDEDYEWLTQWKWCAFSRDGKVWYAVRGTRKKGKPISTLMHRLIAAAPVGLEVDHANGDGLDNRKENLRICTVRENRTNRGPGRNNRSGLKGVYAHRRKWASYIHDHGKTVYLGLFGSKGEAALAYDQAAKLLNGEFARLNYPTPSYAKPSFRKPL